MLSGIMQHERIDCAASNLPDVSALSEGDVISGSRDDMSQWAHGMILDIPL